MSNVNLESLVEAPGAMIATVYHSVLISRWECRPSDAQDNTVSQPYLTNQPILHIVFTGVLMLVLYSEKLSHSDKETFPFIHLVGEEKQPVYAIRH